MPRLSITLGLALLVLLPTSLGADGPPPPVPTSSIALGEREDPPLLLELHLERSVESRFVPLRELVTVLHDDDEVWDVVGEVRVRVREGGFVRRADVSRRIGRAGLTDARFRVTGPAFCTCEISPETGVSR